MGLGYKEITDKKNDQKLPAPLEHLARLIAEILRRSRT